MKMMKLTYLLAFALAVTLADTGCRNHRPVKVTPIPGTPSGQVGELGPGGTMAQGGQVNRRRVNQQAWKNLKAWPKTPRRWPLTRCILPSTAPP